MKKIGSMLFLNPLEPKYESKIAKLSIIVAADWQFLAIFDLFWGFKGLKNHIEPIFFMSGSTKKIFSLKFQIWEKNDVAADWQFLAVFDTFLGFKGFKNPIEPIFFTGEFTKTNFSSKFLFWEKIMAGHLGPNLSKELVDVGMFSMYPRC